MAGQKKVTLKKGKAASKDINVTPLIDVVLVLLIIFMVITPIMIYEMAVNLPDKTETVQRDNLPKDQLLPFPVGRVARREGAMLLRLHLAARRVEGHDGAVEGIERRVGAELRQAICLEHLHPERLPVSELWL